MNEMNTNVGNPGSLTADQLNALQYADTEYRKWIASKREDDTALENSFNALAQHVNDVQYIDFRLVFANTIEEMQKLGWNLSENCITAKTGIYIDAICHYSSVSEYFEWAKPYIWAAMENCSRLMITGEDTMPQDDDTAALCVKVNKALGYPLADFDLAEFARRDDGSYIYTGNRDLLRRNTVVV